MYTAVRTQDYLEYPESEMDDRESLYFDTISLADSEAAAAAAARRKSLSQSRNTIYHSAVDLVGDETPSKRSSMRLENCKNSKTSLWAPNNRHSTALDHYHSGAAGGGGGGVGYGGGNSNDYTDAVIAAQVMALQNGRGTISSSTPQLCTDEVSRRLLQSSTSTSKDKKLPITYSQWKFRTRRRFQDGVRSVDFVLAYTGDDHKLDNLKKREVFEMNLEKEGLHLERDNTQRIHFIKLHAPMKVLCRYAEILKIKLVMKRIPGQEQIDKDGFEFMQEDNITGCWKGICKSIQLDKEKFPKRPYRIHGEFSRNYQHLFDVDQSNFIDAGTRNAIINFILERQRFVEGEETPDNMGIEKLLADGVYDSAYALHDDTDRDLLLSEWANLKKLLSLQPLDNIKEYFGPKVALYFAWLGFYTHMLIPISIIGIICFLYGLFTWSSDPISHQICQDKNTTRMCPQCDRNCDYWYLDDTCSSAKMNYLIDNNMTVVFALVMSLWAVLYLELWKRYSARLIHRWGLTGFSPYAEHPTPQYLSKIRKSKAIAAQEQANTSSILDPDVPFWRVKFLPSFASYGIMVLFICIALIAFSSVIVYRMAQKASRSILGDVNSTADKIMIYPLTAGIIDLIVITLLESVYSKLATYITNLEYCRTQTEYDDSLTIKNYIFQFVNYYASLVYIALVKGQFVGYPAKYNRIFGYRQEECDPGGCLMELCIQLVIIMAGKQFLNAFLEILVPYLLRLLRKIIMDFGYFRKTETKPKLVSCNQWTEDYHLQPWSNSLMYDEYLEMVLQFGFMTLFGLAFPLVPLLALINNVLEVRLDAMKMLRLIRRPVAQRVHSIGVWYGILVIITKIAVAVAAMIIAFSTNLIPKLVYKTVTHDGSLNGYLNFTLAYFNTTDFQEKPILPTNSIYINMTTSITCRYQEFRNPPWDEHPYKRPLVYWRILAARLAFVVVFQNFIGVLQAIISWAIPDTPHKLSKRIKREEYLLREHIIEYEKKIATDRAAEQRHINEAQNGNQITSIEIPIKPVGDVTTKSGASPGVAEAEILRQRYTGRNSNGTFDNDRTTPL